MSDEMQVSEFLSKWLRGLDSEIAFWHTLIATGYPDHECLRPEARTGLPFRYPELLAELGSIAGVVKILDVGSGPISCLGSLSAAPYVIDLKACDPLASAYNAILEKYHVCPPVRTAFAIGELLTSFYPQNSFHIVHMANALDHSFDPTIVLHQMLALCRPGGFILLLHNENEALTQHYEGLHQWNISSEGDQLFFWNRQRRVNVAESLLNRAEVRCVRTEFSDRPAVVQAKIHKLIESEFPETHGAANYEFVFKLLCYQLSTDCRSIAESGSDFDDVKPVARRDLLRSAYKSLGRGVKRQCIRFAKFKGSN